MAKKAMAEKAMAKAVLWDIGNVIVRWDPRTLYSKIFDDAQACDRFLSTVCTQDWHVAHDRGVSFAANRLPLIARFPDQAPLIEAWESRWWDMFSGVIPESEAAIEALAVRGVRQFALSNMSLEVIDGVLAMSPAFRLLEGVVISGELGLIKPDAAIYRAACERFGHAPGDFLFIDDSAANIAAAQALGFDTHHFTDPAALTPALEARGLL
jgi:2-haloacid dehalogenase/putative hydrolase of the HAD superfamily